MVMLGEEVGRGRWGSEVRGGWRALFAFRQIFQNFPGGHVCVLCCVVLCCVVLCVCVCLCVMGGIR